VTAEPLGLPESNIEGTAAVVAVAAYQGVQLLRVHDLPETVQALKVWRGLRDQALTPRNHGA
jgi:dihydropteroate synthase